LGATKRPFYRVVVADARSPRDGRFIEQIGKYHPMEDPSFIEIDGDRALYWLNEGAQPTSQVRNLLKIQGVWATFESSRPAKAPATATAKPKPKSAAAKKASGSEPAPADA
jgi:small subunit ribosomal protein S16